jgi:hypothetical protein
MTTLFLLFNHTLTAPQESEARAALGVDEIVEPPLEILNLWSTIPPDLPGLQQYLEPVRDWLAEKAIPGDHILIQGDFGAVYLLVYFSLSCGLIPIYSTTEREALEKHLPDGSVRLQHTIRHRGFRRYGN